MATQKKLVTAWAAALQGPKHGDMVRGLAASLDHAAAELTTSAEAIEELQRARFVPPAGIKVVNGSYVQGAKVWFKPEVLEKRHYADFVEDKADLDRLVVAKVSGDSVQLAVGDVKGVSFGVYPRGILTLTDQSKKASK